MGIHLQGKHMNVRQKEKISQSYSLKGKHKGIKKKHEAKVDNVDRTVRWRFWPIED